MVNIQALKDSIKESGVTMAALSRKTGILRETLYNRLDGKGEFKASEISAISSVLRLTREERDSIFFAEERE